MRRTEICLGILLLLAFAQAASAEPALTISRPPPRSAAAGYEPGHARPRYRSKSARWEIIHRRAALAARKRAARIQARRRRGDSALRPNLSYDRPVVEWWSTPRYLSPRGGYIRIGSLR